MIPAYLLDIIATSYFVVLIAIGVDANRTKKKPRAPTLEELIAVARICEAEAMADGRTAAATDQAFHDTAWPVYCHACRGYGVIYADAFDVDGVACTQCKGRRALPVARKDIR